MALGVIVWRRKYTAIKRGGERDDFCGGESGRPTGRPAGWRAGWLAAESFPSPPWPAGRLLSPLRGHLFNALFSKSGLLFREVAMRKEEERLVFRRPDLEKGGNEGRNFLEMLENAAGQKQTPKDIVSKRAHFLEVGGPVLSVFDPSRSEEAPPFSTKNAPITAKGRRTDDGGSLAAVFPRDTFQLPRVDSLSHLFDD